MLVFPVVSHTYIILFTVVPMSQWWYIVLCNVFLESAGKLSKFRHRKLYVYPDRKIDSKMTAKHIFSLVQVKRTKWFLDPFTGFTVFHWSCWACQIHPFTSQDAEKTSSITRSRAASHCVSPQESPKPHSMKTGLTPIRTASLFAHTAPTNKSPQMPGNGSPSSVAYLWYSVPVGWPQRWDWGRTGNCSSPASRD